MEAINILTKAKGVTETELEEDHKWRVLIESQSALLHECIVNEEQEIMRKRRHERTTKPANTEISY